MLSLFFPSSTPLFSTSFVISISFVMLPKGNLKISFSVLFAKLLRKVWILISFDLAIGTILPNTLTPPDPGPVPEINSEPVPVPASGPVPATLSSTDSNRVPTLILLLSSVSSLLLLISVSSSLVLSLSFSSTSPVPIGDEALP